MRRADFLKLTDIAVEDFKNHMRRGVLPFIEDQDEAGERRWSDYSARDVLQTCVAMELVKTGLELRAASSLVVLADSTLRVWWPFIEGPPPIMLGAAWFENAGKPVQIVDRLVAVKVERSVPIVGPVSHLTAVLAEGNYSLDRLPISRMVFVSASRVVGVLRARAAKYDINLDLDAFYAPAAG